METEPVVASEPLFSAGPSVQRHVPAIPNGSGAQAKPAECSGKLTAEKLAAIDDEELLDKMVFHAKVIILDDLKLLFKWSSVMGRVCVLTLNLASWVKVYLENHSFAYCVSTIVA